MENNKNNNEREQWIDRVMVSTRGMQRAMPAADLYEKITHKLNNQPSVRVMALPYIRWAAAAVLLISVNVATIKYYSSLNYASGQNAGNTNPIASEMQLESTYNY